MLNVHSNQLNQSKIKNIEDGAKGSGFFFFFYCKRRSGACCVVGFSCSKLRSRTSSGACCVAIASSHAPKPKSSEACCIATSKFRSLLQPPRRLDIELGVCTLHATPPTSLPYEPFDLNAPLRSAFAMPSPGASALEGELGRTQRKRGGTTRGTPAMASDPRAQAAFKFLASLAARTHIGTRPHIQRRETRHRPPCLGIEDRMHPTERPTPGERSAGCTQHASHRILSQRRTGTPPLGAELRRDKRFCGEPWSDEPGGGEPHATQQALTLRSRKAPKLTALQQAPEPDKLRSLLRCSSKLSRSGACCCNGASSHALELAALQQQAPELGALQGLVAASKLRSREAPEKLRSLELACLFKQNKQK